MNSVQNFYSKIRFIIVSLTSLVIVAASHWLQAAPGDLDQTFGLNGVTFTDFSAAGAGATGIVLSDNKIVVAGSVSFGSDAAVDFSLARYNDDGTLDSSFGTGGLVTTDFEGNQDI